MHNNTVFKILLTSSEITINDFLFLFLTTSVCILLSFFIQNIAANYTLYMLAEPNRKVAWDK